MTGTHDWCALNQSVTVTPNTSYTLSYWGKLGANSVYLKVLNPTNGVILDAGYQAASSVWTFYTVNFNSGNNSTVKPKWALPTTQYKQKATKI